MTACNLQPASLINSYFRSACAIPDPDNEEVIITGGWETMTKASVYNEDGWQRDLPSFSEGRRHHACSSFLSSGKRVGPRSLVRRTEQPLMLKREMECDVMMLIQGGGLMCRKGSVNRSC